MQFRRASLAARARRLKNRNDGSPNRFADRQLAQREEKGHSRRMSQHIEPSRRIQLRIHRRSYNRRLGRLVKLPTAIDQKLASLIRFYEFVSLTRAFQCPGG